MIADVKVVGSPFDFIHLTIIISLLLILNTPYFYNLCLYTFSVRAICGLNLQKNCVHGSDSPQSASREISFFFKTKSSGQTTNPFYVSYYMHAYYSWRLSFTKSFQSKEKAVFVGYDMLISNHYFSDPAWSTWIIIGSCIPYLTPFLRLKPMNLVLLLLRLAITRVPNSFACFCNAVPLLYHFKTF